MRRRASILALGLLSLWLCGFQGARPQLPSGYLPVPILRQATNYSCGASAAQAVLQYWGVYEEPESDLYALLKTDPKNGTDPRSLTDGLKSFGLSVRMQEQTTFDELREAYRNGETVILDLQAWRDDETTDWKDTWEDGHYLVMVAIDDKFLYAMDPVIGTGYGAIPLDELAERWHDYEIKDGVVWRNHRLAIFVKGTKPLGQFPAPLIYIP